MIFLCDRSLGRHQIVSALKARGVQAIALDDHMLSYKETSDDVWLSDAGSRGWFVLTKDGKMRGRGAEKQALIEYRVGCFAVAAGDMKAQDVITILVNAWPQIERICSEEPRPFYYVVWKDGSVHRREL